MSKRKVYYTETEREKLTRKPIIMGPAIGSAFFLSISLFNNAKMQSSTDDLRLAGVSQ